MKGCEEKVRLLADYQAAAKKYSDSVGELNQKMGTSSRDQYERLQRISDETRMKSEQARPTFEQHTAAHRC